MSHRGLLGSQWAMVFFEGLKRVLGDFKSFGPHGLRGVNFGGS